MCFRRGGETTRGFRLALEGGRLLPAEGLAQIATAQTGKKLPLGTRSAYQRAALRWHARLETELGDLTLEESLWALSALEPWISVTRAATATALR
jgi:hypothetical protein